MFLTINAIIAAVYGLGLVFVPSQVVSLYGYTADAGLSYTGQLFGAALLTFAVLTWLARDLPDSAAMRAILLALFVGDVVGFIVALLAQFGGTVATFGWSTVAIYGLLAIGLGYFRFVASGGSSTEHGKPM
jgi:hypothetical protein